MKKLLLILLTFLVIPQLCYARIIFDPESKVLLVGGLDSYFDAQPYEGRDHSLNKKIVKYDLKNYIKKLFFSSDDFVMRILLSPKGKYVAIKTKKEKQNYFSIVIVNSGGEKITIIKNCVGIFEWSPDSRYLAYITGELLSESRQPFKSDGLWLYDIKEDKKEKIEDSPYYMRFARHDGKLHYGINDGKGPVKFYVYDTTAKESVGTSTYGLDFSPNGKYFVEGYEYNDYRLSLSKGNKTVHWFAGLNFKEVYWLNNELIFNFFLPRSFVYDVFKRKIVHEFEGTVMGWSADRRYVVSYKNKEAIITETISGEIFDRIKIRQ